MSEIIDYKDTVSFHKLYNKYYKALVLYGMKFLDDSQQAAEDIVQDVFSLLWHKKLDFDNEVKLKVYLYNSVRNNSLDFLKHRHVEISYINKVKAENPLFSTDPQQQEQPFSEEIYRQLFEAIEKMPARQQEIFLMAMDGKPNREIAKTLGITIDTVKTQKRRAKMYLKENLNPEAWLFLLYLLNNL